MTEARKKLADPISDGLIKPVTKLNELVTKTTVSPEAASCAILKNLYSTQV